MATCHDGKQVPEETEDIGQLAEVFFKTTLDMACVADEEKFRQVNDRWVETLGWSRKELLSRPFASFVHPDDLMATGDAVGRLSQGEDVVEFENRYATADGGWRNLVWNSRIDPDTGLIMATARDVSKAREHEAERQRLHRIFESLAELQAFYIRDGLSRAWWETAISRLIEVTASSFGFVGRVRTDEEGAPYLHTLAVTNIAWNTWSQNMFDEYAETGLEFRNLDTLFGYTLRTGESLLTNDPSADPRAGGLPEGHPPLESYAGIPLTSDHGMIGMVGLANRAGGFDQSVMDEIEPFVALLSQTVSQALASEEAERAEEETERLEKRLQEVERSGDGERLLVKTTQEVLDQTSLSGSFGVVDSAIREIFPPAKCALYLSDLDHPDQMRLRFTGGRMNDVMGREAESFERGRCRALVEGRVQVSRPGLELGSCSHVVASNYATVCSPLVAGDEEFGLLTVSVASQMDIEGLNPLVQLREVTDRLSSLSTALAQVASRERLVARSLVDHLTGLPNRAAFEQFGERLITARGSDARPFGLILFDLDGFKPINDTFGHQVGDKVLVAAASAAKSALRPEDMVSRIGGDEFGALIPHCQEPQLEHAAERVRHAIADLDLDVGAQAEAHASVGALLIGESAVTWEQVFESADTAMYDAKGQGGDCVVVG